MNLSEIELIGLVLCYFAIGLLLAMKHWLEYIPTYSSIFTKVHIEWKHFLGKLFFWPFYGIYYVGWVLLLAVVVFYYFTKYKLKGLLNETAKFK